MPRAKPLLLLALVAALMALPAAPVLAQSAGDDQYQDPLGGGATTQPSAPSRPAQKATAPTSTPSHAARARAPQRVQLARTGFDAWIPAVAGLTLLALGLLLLRWPRRRTP